MWRPFVATSLKLVCPTMGSSRGGVRRQVRRLSDPRVISWPLFWFTYVWFVIDALPKHLAVDSHPLQGIAVLLVTASAAQLVTFAILVLAKYTYLRPPIARRHPSWTVVSFAIATFFGARVARTVGLVLAPDSVGEIEPELINHTITQTIALCVFGIVVVALREHQADITRLATAREGLIATRTACDLALVEEREQVLQRVRRVADELSEALRNATASEASQALGHAADDVIRPLSHDLVLAAPEVTSQAVDDVPGPSWLATFRSVASGTPLIRPAAMGALVTFLAARLTVTGPSPEALESAGQGVTVSVDVTELLETIALLGIVFFAVWASARLALGVLHRFSLNSGKAAWPATIIATLAVAVVSQLVIAGVYFAVGYQPPVTTAAGLSAAPLFLVVLVVAIVKTIADQRSATVAELHAVNDELDWELHRTNGLLWQQRRALSTWLHGALQSALNAGSIQIANSANGTPDVDAAVRLFIEASDRVPGDVESRGLCVELDAVRATWAPICQVSWTLEGHTAALIEHDPLCVSTVIDVVVECCSNSAIHGGASVIDICLAAQGERSVRLVVTDNGQLPDDPEEGLGTRMLNDVCLSWRRSHGLGGTVVEARLPLRIESPGVPRAAAQAGVE